MIEAVIFDWGRTLYDKENGQLFPETIDVLEYCSKKYRLGIVSLAIDGGVAERYELLEKFGMRKYFEFVYFDVENKDAIFNKAFETLGLPFDNIAIVDDRMYRIALPIKLGCTVIWLKNGKFADEVPNEQTGLPTHVIRSLGELRNLL